MIKDILEKIGIDKEYIQSDDNTYVIDIDNSNEYGKIYTKLDNSELLEEDSDSSTITIDNSNIKFDGDTFEFTLIADFVADEYKLVIKDNTINEGMPNKFNHFSNPDDCSVEGIMPYFI